jgi:hypothetical protein
MTRDIKTGEKLTPNLSRLLTKGNFTPNLTKAIKNAGLDYTTNHMYQIITKCDIKLNSKHIKVIEELIKIINDNEAVKHVDLFDKFNDAKIELEKFENERVIFNKTINKR